MFPRKFENLRKKPLEQHHSITFQSNLKEKEIVSKIMAMGVAKFLNYDNQPTSMSWGSPAWAVGTKGYTDNRIAGTPTYYTSVGCNSHMKNQNLWTLFPIHKKHLDNLGYKEDHLIAWIKFLNDMNIGLKYYYFGEQEGTAKTADKWQGNSLVDDVNSYYWVFMPAHKKDKHWKRVYLQWVLLRYLINTTQCKDLLPAAHGIQRFLGYDNIPRIAMMLHEDLGLSRHKALLYAQLANPFYYYWGMNFSDRLYLVESPKMYYFDVSVKNTELKKLLKETTGSMNSTLCVSNTGNIVENILKRPLKASYNPKQLFKLFEEGKYKEFVQQINKSYKITKAKTVKNVKKEKAIA